MSDAVVEGRTEHNKTLVRRIVDEMFNEGKLDVSSEIFGPTFVDRGHEGDPNKQDGPEGWAEFVKAVRIAVPDLNATIHNMIAEGDYVAMWNTATGTHSEALFGIPPSGKRIRMKDFHFFRFFDSKIVEHWNQVNVVVDE